MRQHIGTKIIEAEPAFRMKTDSSPNGYRIYPGDIEIPSDALAREGIEEGYRVRYPDGYESWSPKAVFEEAYRPTDGMNFGLAIEAAKKGAKITRRGWNGKGQYVELASCISYTNHGGSVVNAEHDAIGNQALAFAGTSGVQMGWLASQADMLADDWEIVE